MRLINAWLGLTLLMMTPTISLACQDGEIRKTMSGSSFVCDNQFPELKDAWRDPNGLIWGDAYVNADGTLQMYSHQSALDICNSLGAHLPSSKEWATLKTWMNDRLYWQPLDAVKEEPILPHSIGAQGIGWSFAVAESAEGPNQVYFFFGTGKEESYYDSDNGFKLPVRCVRLRNR